MLLNDKGLICLSAEPLCARNVNACPRVRLESLYLFVIPVRGHFFSNEKPNIKTQFTHPQESVRQTRWHKILKIILALED